MQEIDVDEAKTSRIYILVQTHAHGDMVDEGDEDLTLLAASRSVLGDVMDFMRAADSDHVSRMIARVTPA